VEITDFVAMMGGMVLVALLEGVVALATMENQVLEVIKEGMDLVATMVGLVLEEEIVEEERVSVGAQIAREVALVLQVV
jgi:hypothetical protein